MFEDVTYEGLLQAMLGRAAVLFPELDVREGSLLYTALAPAAAELQNLYIALDAALDESFADTASRAYLIRRCAERGITPSGASAAVVRAVMRPEEVYVSAGTRFSCGACTYTVVSEEGGGTWQLRCETAGTAGNLSSGTLLPLGYVAGLTGASITELLIPGEDEEDTESLRQRYFDNIAAQPFGGNCAQYKEYVMAIGGVGGVKIYPAASGGGTVRLCIIDSDFGVPSDALVALVQVKMDPTESAGKGTGLAPIGHVVTVTGVLAQAVDTTLAITYAAGWSWTDLEPYVTAVIDAYFDELARGWAGADALVVRISQIETRVLELDGVVDVADTLLDGAARNVTLPDDRIPVRGSVTCYE